LESQFDTDCNGVEVWYIFYTDEEQFNEEEAAANDREGGDDVEGRLESLKPPMIPTP
jgi:hypothetical protein